MYWRQVFTCILEWISSTGLFIAVLFRVIRAVICWLYGEYWAARCCSRELIQHNYVECRFLMKYFSVMMWWGSANFVEEVCVVWDCRLPVSLFCFWSRIFPLAQVVFSSCELGVFDLLLGAERPLSAEEISEAVGASVDGTERLLAACAGLQLLNIHQDNGRSRRPPTHSQILTFSCVFVISRSLSHHVPPFSCVFFFFLFSVQCCTATQSRPVFTWLVPVLCPCPSPSSTVPKPSTSAGTTWRMLSGESAANHLPFYCRRCLQHHHEGRCSPG